MKPDDAALWIGKAEQDWRVARKLDPATEPDAICFHCQQCAEKYLKALLVRARRRFPKTHDLGILLNLVAPGANHLRKHENDLSDLNPYSVIARYPGLDTTPAEAREARVITRRVRLVLRRLLGL
ncbi:MAG: HEPN domain-containing protein [Euryarchaeota archaeon]|nr:HEPN domain-containing protein [Euryarchaeota archaeon]